MARVVESDSVPGGSDAQLSLESIRESLIRQEDTILFSLIERAKFPLNSAAFDESLRCLVDSGNSSSLTEFYVREIETIQAKVVRGSHPNSNSSLFEKTRIACFYLKLDSR